MYLIGDKFEYLFGKAFEFSSFKLFLSYLFSLINFSMPKIKTGNAHNSKEKILKRGNRYIGEFFHNERKT